MNRLKKVVHEIHRRSLWQVVGIYVGGSWLAFEVTQTLTEGLGLPDWVPPLALVLLVVGLPVVIATAFVQEGLGSQARAEPAAGPHAVDRPTEGPASISKEVREPSAALPAHHRVFTWRNALLGIFAAFALLGLGTSGYMAMRTLGIGPAGTLIAKGTLQERDTLVLADFTGPDPSLARTVTEALRIDLAQSPTVTLLPAGDLRDVLERMRRDPHEPLTPDVAREVAIREGLKGVIGGSVHPAGNGFLLAVQLIAAADGKLLFGDRATATDDDGVIPAIDKLSRKLRERIGEPLKNVRQSPRLPRRATASLEALQKYAQAVHAHQVLWEMGRAIQLAKEAVRLDTTFAMGYRKLGVLYGNARVSRARELESFAKAMEHADRLTAQERYSVEGIHHLHVTKNYAEAAAAYHNALETNPDSTVLNNLGVAYWWMRDFRRAEQVLQRAVERGSIYPLNNLTHVQYALGRFDEARATMERSIEARPGQSDIDLMRSNMVAGDGDYEQAEALVRRNLASRPDLPGLQARAHTSLAWLLLIQGKLGEAEDELRQALQLREQRAEGHHYLRMAVELAALSTLFRGDTVRGAQIVDEALRRFPLDSIEPLDRPYDQLAAFYARVGKPDRARALIGEFETEVAHQLGGDPRGVAMHAARGFLALAEDRFEDAIRLFDELNARNSEPCPMCWLGELGHAYDRAGLADSAVAVYERFLGTPWLDRTEPDAHWKPRALERLGQLYDDRGDLENAAKYYAQFVELWAEADPELQPRVRAAQERLQEIVAERG